MTTLMRKFLAATAVLIVALVGLSVAGASTQPHYTDGTQCDGGQFCTLPSVPPPVPPHFAEGGAGLGECAIDIVDPPSFTFLTEHFVYGTTAPAAGVVPVHDDASVVVNYVGSAPGSFPIDVTAFVAGKQGFRADTWNIGKGVTAWVPFDCTTPESTSTTTSTTTTVPASTTSTTSVEIGPPAVVTAAPAPAVVAQPALTG